LCDWLQEIYQQVETGTEEGTDRAIDILFKHIDTMFLDGEFEGCNEILPKIDLERLDTNLLVGLLSITVAAKDKLPSRPELVRRIEERLTILAPDRVRRLVSDLRR